MRDRHELPLTPMGLKEQLDTFAQSLTVIAGGGATPGALITARLSPDPAAGLVDSVPGGTRTTFLLKMLRFGDDTLPDAGTTIADFLAVAGQILGGQAMPALNVQLPGPALPGARIPVHTLTNTRAGALPTDLLGLNVTEDVPSSSTSPGQPSVGQASTTNLTQNVLAGVPGIVGVIETGIPKPTPIAVDVSWDCKVIETNVEAMAHSTSASVHIVPPVTFADLTESAVFTLSITATGTLTLPDPADPAHPITSTFATPSVDVHFPGIPLPRLLGLFTWPIYGTEATAHDADPDDSSLLLMFPADAPLSGVDSVMSALIQVRTTVAPILSLVSSPQLTALLAGLDRFANRMNVAFHGAYIGDDETSHRAVAEQLGAWWHRQPEWALVGRRVARSRLLPRPCEVVPVALQAERLGRDPSRDGLRRGQPADAHDR